MAGHFDHHIESNLNIKPEISIQKPKLFKVLLHNDDYSTMEFVVEVLNKIFKMPAAKATKIMLDVHKKGTGVCGTYTLDIAATKVQQVHEMAQEQEFPLRSSFEEA